MEKEKMLQIAVPAIAIAAIIVVVALIMSGSSTPVEATKPGSGVLPPLPPGKKTVAEVASNAEGVGMTKPDTAAPQWADLVEGLKYWDVKIGEGDIGITDADDGLWHYTGWLNDGKIFDSSLRKGEPITFNLKQVIKGWTLGLAGMKPGGVRRLYIPSPLAYGSEKKGNEIPANSDLIFEVKLIRISR